MEGGDLNGVSESVLNALAEHCNSTTLSARPSSTSPGRAAWPRPGRPPAVTAAARPAVQQLLDAITGAAAA